MVEAKSGTFVSLGLPSAVIVIESGAGVPDPLGVVVLVIAAPAIGV